MRVFEDSRYPTGDPRRFRVEILFSAGATATPFRLDGDSRSSDLSRVQTAPLEKIGRDDVTCQELEHFFEHAIMAGRSDDDSPGHSLATIPPPDTIVGTGKKPENQPLEPERDPAVAPIVEINEPATIVPCLHDDLLETSMDDCLPPMHDVKQVSHDCPTEVQPKVIEHVREKILTPLDEADDLPEEPHEISDGEDDSMDRSDVFRKVIARKKFWSIVAIGSFIVGMACFSYAFRRDERPQRRWSSQR